MSSPEFQQHILVRKEAKTILPTIFGEFRSITYTSDEGVHMALLPLNGEYVNDESVPIRVHTECFIGDRFGYCKYDCGARLQESLRYISERGEGAVIYTTKNSTLCRPVNGRDNQIAQAIANDLEITHEK